MRTPLYSLQLLVLALSFLLPATQAAAPPPPDEEQESAEDALMRLQEQLEESREQSTLTETASLQQQLFALADRSLGSHHPYTLSALNEQGLLCRRVGDLDCALESYELLLSRLEEIPEVDGASRAGILSNLGAVLGDLYRYGEAEAAYSEALALTQAAYGEDYRLTAALHNNLATLLSRTDKLSEAVYHFELARPVFQESYGPTHSNTLSLTASLGLSLCRMGQTARGVELLEWVIAELRASEDPNLYLLAQSLNSLAAMQARLGRLEQAVSLGEEALSILRSLNKRPDVTTTLVMDNLTKMLTLAGLTAKAEALAEELAGSQRAIWGKDSPQLAGSVVSLARLAQSKGESEAALQHYRRANQLLGESEAAGLTQHISLLSELAQLLYVLGHEAETLSTFAQLTSYKERYLMENLIMGRPGDKLRILRELSALLNQLSRMSFREPAQQRLQQELMYSIVLKLKGRILEVESDQLSRLRDIETPGVQEQLGALQEQTEALQQLHLEIARGEGEIPLQVLRQRSSELVALKKSLAAQSPEFAQLTRSATSEEVQAMLPEGAVLLEWHVLPSLEGEAGALDYAGFLLSSAGLLSFERVGSVEAINEDLMQLHRHLQREASMGHTELGPRSERLLRRLDAQLLDPFSPSLGETDHLIISPSRQLSMLPLDLLMNESGELLMDRYLLTTVVTGRELLRMSDAAPPAGAALIVSGADFGQRSKAAGSAAAQVEEVLPLPGSAREGQALHEMMPGSSLFQGAQASETRLKSVRSPSILHIATHAFQWAAPDQGRDSPMLQQGLVLAGANQGGDGESNGYLSAAELSMMDLRGTELAVLSACETGLGETLQPLRHGLILAGAQAQVLSLWKVHDDATQALMELYYEELLRGKSRAEALSAAKRRLRSQPPYQNPIYWAAFVLSGEWGALEHPTQTSPWRRLRAWLDREHTAR